MHELLGNHVIHAALSAPEADGHQGLVRGALTASLAEAPSVVQRLADNSSAQAALRRSQGPNLPAGGGRPLPAPLQARVERAFGRDLSRARVHEDAASRAKASELGAVAFTSGSDIFAGPGVDLEDERCWEVLVHEMVHVEQFLDGRLAGKRGVAPDSDPHEVEARQRTGPLLRQMGVGPAGAQGGAPRPAAPGPQASLDELDAQLEAPLPESVRERMAARLEGRLPEPDPDVEAGLAATTRGAAAPWLQRAPPTRAEVTPAQPAPPALAPAHSPEEAFTYVERSFSAALDAEAQTRRQRRAASAAASPTGPVLSDALALASAQGEAERASMQGRAQQDAQGLEEEGQGQPAPQPSAPAASGGPRTPSQPTLQRMSAPDSEGAEAQAPQAAAPGPAAEGVAGSGASAQGSAGRGAQAAEASVAAPSGGEGLSPVAPPVASPSTRAPTLEVEQDPVAEAAQAVEDAQVDLDLTRREQELAQRDLDELRAEQREAEARARAAGHPEDVQGAPSPQELASAADGAERADVEVEAAQEELDAARREERRARRAARGSGGKGSGGAAPPPAELADEAAAAAAEEAAALAAEQAEGEAAADGAALEQDAAGALTELLSELQALAQQLLADAEALAQGVLDAGAQAAKAARDRAKAEADKLLADARSEADAARSSAGEDGDDEDSGDAQARADAEADRILAEAEGEAAEVRQRGEEEAQALLDAAQAEAEALRAQGEEAAAQAEATGEAGAEALRGQLQLAQQQLTLDAQASVAGLEAERDAAVAATRELEAEASRAIYPSYDSFDELLDAAELEQEIEAFKPDYGPVLADVEAGEVLTPAELHADSSDKFRPNPTSPLLDHLRTMPGDAGFDAEALGVSPQAIELLASSPEALTWEQLSEAGLSKEDREALQRAAAQDMVAGLDPEQDANLVLSWFDPSQMFTTGSNIRTVRDYEAISEHLENTLHLGNAGLDEVAAILGTGGVDNLVLSTHGVPGGQYLKGADGELMSVVDTPAIAQMAAEGGVDNVLLSLCYGGLGAETPGAVDPVYGQTSSSSASEFVARGMNVLAAQGEINSESATRAMSLWAQLVGAGASPEDAMQLAGAYTNATGLQNLASMGWGQHAGHSREELGPENDPTAWGNEHGFIESWVGGQLMGAEQLEPLLQRWMPTLVGSESLEKQLRYETYNFNDPRKATAEILGRTAVPDLLWDNDDRRGEVPNPTLQWPMSDLLFSAWYDEETLAEEPIVRPADRPELAARVRPGLDAQAAYLMNLPPEDRQALGAAPGRLQESRDATYTTLAAHGQGVATASGQLRFLSEDDLTAPPRPPPAAPVVDEASAEAPMESSSPQARSLRNLPEHAAVGEDPTAGGARGFRDGRYTNPRYRVEAFKPKYGPVPEPLGPGEAVDPSVAKPYEGHSHVPYEASPLLDHLRGMSGEDGAPLDAEGLGVSAEALAFVAENPEALTWEALSEAGLSAEDRAALQSAAALDMVSGLDPEQSANLVLSWYDREHVRSWRNALRSERDYTAVSEHLENTVHLGNAGLDEVEAILGTGAFTNLVLSTHGEPGGVALKDAAGDHHDLLDSGVMAELAAQGGVENVLLSHCFGGLGADEAGAVDTLYQQGASSSASEYAARGMNVMAAQGAILDETSNRGVSLWAELVAAGASEADAMRLAGAYVNATGLHDLDSMDWADHAGHARAELGPENNPAEWGNTHGFMETWIGGQLSGAEDVAPLVQRWTPELMASAAMQKHLRYEVGQQGVSGTQAASDVLGRMAVPDLMWATHKSDYRVPLPTDHSPLRDLIMGPWSANQGDPWRALMRVQQRPDLVERARHPLDAQAAYLQSLPSEDLVGLEPVLGGLQQTADAVYTSLAASGQGVATESGQLRFLPDYDLTTPLSTSEGLPVADGASAEAPMASGEAPGGTRAFSSDMAPTEASAAPPMSLGWQREAQFEDGGLSVEATNGASSLSASVNGGLELSGLAPVDEALPAQAGGRVSLSNGRLELGLQGGLTREVNGTDLQAIAYGGLTFGQGGEITGFHAGGSVDYGGVQASLAFSYEDRDFATFVPPADGAPGMVFYGNSAGYDIGGGAAVPVGPFVVGADGSIQRSLTVQAFTSLANLPGLDPTLARTDPKAYRDAVAAQMAGMTEGIASAEDLSVDAILGWEAGSGLMLERVAGEGVGGSFGAVAVGVNGGVEAQRVEQLSVQRNADGTVSVTVTSQDTDSFRAGLNAGPAGLSGTQADTSSSSVTFHVNPDSPEGRAALEGFLQTGSLPGALDFAAGAGVIPQSVDLSDPNQVQRYVVEANRAFLLAQGDRDARWGPEQSGANYTGVDFSDAMARSTSLSVLGFQVLSSMTQESWQERMYAVGDDWETNYLYDQQETWMFSRDSHVSGVSVNPQAGAYLGMMQQQDADLGWIEESGLADLVDAAADPFSALYVAGIFSSVDFNNEAPRVSLGLGLGEADLLSIRDELDAMGAVNERLASVDAAVDSRLLGFLNDNLHAGLSFDPVSGEVTVTDPGETLRLDELGTYMGVGGDEAVALFGAGAQDPGFIAQTLQNVVNADPADFVTLSPLEQELYLRVGLSAYTEPSPYMANAEGDPYDMLGLVLQVEDPETRDALLRRSFYAVEQAEEGAQGTLAFLQWSEQLSPELQARIREGATLQVVGAYLPTQQVLDGLLTGGSDSAGGEAMLHTLGGLSVEDRGRFFDALPQLMNSQQFLEDYAAAHGEPFPYAAEGPVAWMFAGLDDPFTQAQLLTLAQGTPYAAELLRFAEDHPEAFLQREFRGDPGSIDAAVATLVGAGVDPMSLGLPAERVLGHLHHDPSQRGDWLVDMAGTPSWPALQQTLLDDPGLLFGDLSAEDQDEALALLDALRGAGVDDAVISNLLARSVCFDESDQADAQAWVDQGQPQEVGARLRDVQDDIDWPGGHTREEWMTGLLMGVAGDVDASRAAMQAYVAADGGDAEGAVDGLLGQLAGDPNQLALAAQVLEQAGYGVEVARWRGARGW
ncbi:MAG: DUF4157 domain-containing protein [Alphaproteobacteria bacterium]|nr:DUF4157 domain-containing protein [Alphaproteobacteria bacterium]